MTTPLDDDKQSASLDLGDEETPHECQTRAEFWLLSPQSHMSYRRAPSPLVVGIESPFSTSSREPINLIGEQSDHKKQQTS